MLCVVHGRYMLLNKIMHMALKQLPYVMSIECIGGLLLHLRQHPNSEIVTSSNASKNKMIARMLKEISYF
jgi:hypothetical protein